MRAYARETSVGSRFSQSPAPNMRGLKLRGEGFRDTIAEDRSQSPAPNMRGLKLLRLLLPRLCRGEGARGPLPRT